MQFQSTSKGRLWVHVLPTKQFRTRHLSIKVVRPLSKENVTAEAMLPYLWMDGTTTYPSAQNIMKRADDLFGSVIRTGVSKRGNRHVLEIGAAVPDEAALSHAVGLMEQVSDFACELLMQPLLDGDAFAPGNVVREKALHRKRIESVFDDKAVFAMDRCAELTCRGEDVGLPRLGFVSEVDSMTGEKLFATYQTLLNEADVHVYIVGNVDVQETVALWQTALESFTRQSIDGQSIDNTSKRLAMKPLPRGVHDVQTVVERQSIAQGKLNLGYRTGLAFPDDLYAAVMMMNGVLGGFPHSKLFVNVREKASLAYYASSRTDSMTGMLAIQTGIEVDQYDKALAIILAQVNELKAGKLSNDEIEFTRRGLTNQYQQLRDQPLSIADLHFNGVLTGRNREIDTILAEIASVSAEDIVAAASLMALDTIYFLRNTEGESVNE